MSAATQAQNNKAAILASLPMRADEDPFVVAIGGFHRRWFNLIDDMQLRINTVAKIKSTEDEDWVPLWSAVAADFEKKGDALLARRDRAGARRAYVQAKTYYSLARFPSPYWSGSSICPPNMSPIKAQSYVDLNAAIDAAFREARRLLEDHARRHDHRAREHSRAEPARARVMKVFPQDGYGFLVTPEAREIFFDERSVLDGAFGRLRAGSPVRFAGEAGEEGPQASTVTLARRERRSP